MVAETTFLLTSYEWVLVKPTTTSGDIIGNTLLVQGGTDIDSIVVSWGDNVKLNKKFNSILNQQ